MFIDLNLAIPNQVRNDGTLFVILNLFQGRKGDVYRPQPRDSESSSEWRRDFVTLNLFQGRKGDIYQLQSDKPDKSLLS